MYLHCTVYIQNLSTFYPFIKKLFKVNMLLFLSIYYSFLLYSSLGYTQLGRYLWYEIPYPIIASCVQVGKKGKDCFKKGVKFEGILQYWVWRCMLNPYNYPLRFVFSPRVRKIFANFHHYLRNAIFWHTTNSWGIIISLILVKHLILFLIWHRDLEHTYMVHTVRTYTYLG